MAIPKEKFVTADEFLLMDFNDGIQYELIDGEIIKSVSPSEIHQDIVREITTEINLFIRKNKGNCKLFVSPFDVKISPNDVVQPDLFIVCDPSKCNGKRIDGSPDFIIEITSDNRSNDYSKKYNLYLEYGVREYWIVDTKYRRTVVYHFEKTYFPRIYTFDMPIPISIYDGKIQICIADLLDIQEG